MATLITDNFDSYSSGNLVGQGGWTQPIGTSQFIIGNSYFINGKGVSTLAAVEDVVTSNLKTAVSNGRQTIYIKPFQNNKVIEMIFNTLVYPSGTSAGDFQFRTTGDAGIIANTTFTTCGNYIANSWNVVEIEWRNSPSNQYRARLNFGKWTAWSAGFNNGNMNAARTIYFNPRAGGAFAFDQMQEYPQTNNILEQI